MRNGACVHYVMVSKFQWKPAFRLATQRDPQNDWTATQNRVNNDVFAQAPFFNFLVRLLFKCGFCLRAAYMRSPESATPIKAVWHVK